MLSHNGKKLVPCNKRSRKANPNLHPSQASLHNSRQAGNSGIYKIVNRVSGKFYIGSAVKLSNRFSKHISDLRKNIHANSHLQNAWNRHGEDCFEFLVVEYISEKETLVPREQFYIDSLNAVDCGYNLSRDAQTRLGAKHSEETRAKMRISHAGKKWPASRSRTISEETRRKLIAARTGLVKSPETKLKIKNTNIATMKKKVFIKYSTAICERKAA